MQNLVKTSLAILALVVGGTAAHAQTDQTQPSTPHGQSRRHAPNPERETRMLTRRLSLTPEQAAAVEPILADRAQKMEALKPAAGAEPDFQAMHARRKAIMEDSKAKLDAVLTDTQKQQLASMHEHGPRGHRGDWNKNGSAPSPSPAA